MTEPQLTLTEIENQMTFIKLQKLIDESYKLKRQNKKLIEFVKWLSKIENVSTFEFPCEFNCNEIIARDAKALLREIGESHEL